MVNLNRKSKEDKEELEDFAYLPASQLRPSQKPEKAKTTDATVSRPQLSSETEFSGLQRKPGNVYLEPPPEFDKRFDQLEPYGQRVAKGMKSNPFVPLGLSVTVFALCYGVYQLKTGDGWMSLNMMRLRVGAQGFTILALMGGAVYEGYKQSKLRKAERENEINAQNNL